MRDTLPLRSDDGGEGGDDASSRLDRRSVLKGAAAVAGAGLTGLATRGYVGAESPPADPLVVNDFESGAYPGANRLGYWADARALEGQAVEDGVLRLEYDDAGFFATKVFQQVTARYLVLGIRGTEGGEETGIQLEVGDSEGLLADLLTDHAGVDDGTTLGTTFESYAVDLADLGVDGTTVDDVRLNFWQGESGAVEVASIAFAQYPGVAPLPGDETPTPTPSGPTPGGPNTTPTVEPEPFPWEAEAGNEKEPDPSAVPDPSAIGAETTLAELCPTFDDAENAHMYVPRTFESLPDQATDPGDVDVTETNLSDAEKAGLYDVDLDAARSKAASGDVTLGELGTQAIDHVRTCLENGLPYHATAKLLVRLMLLPDETENLPYHKGGDPWAETAGPATPGNDPGQFVQHEWPTDAATYVADEKYERDRAHDQPDHEDGWTNGTPGEEVYADEDHPLLSTIENNEHPVTGEPLGEGFTANAPMEVEVKINEQRNGDYFYQVLNFENTQEVPYYVDAAVLWWVGPAGLSTLRNGHYNNPHRPSPGKGHPQRDIIEVIYDRERSLSAYAVRIAQHDEPYNMRTAYPNQMWGLEQGTPASDPINGGDRFTSSEERQALVDTMLDTLHVELESNLDRNGEIVDALQLHNRVSN